MKSNAPPPPDLAAAIKANRAGQKLTVTEEATIALEKYLRTAPRGALTGAPTPPDLQAFIRQRAQEKKGTK